MSALNEYMVPGLIKNAPSPCLSLYQKTHRTFPENRQDTLRYTNLLSTLQRSLAQKYPAREIQTLLEPYLQLADDEDFWTHALDGLAVFGAPGFFHAYRFQGSPRELAIAADSFHTKPLLRVMQSSRRFHILSLSRTTAAMFEADQYSIDALQLPSDFPATLEQALGSELSHPEITLASFGPAAGGGVRRHGHSSRRDEEEIDAEKFFRQVDSAVSRMFSNTSGMPLMLAALPEHQGLFRKISKNERLIKEAMTTDPQHLSEEQLKSAHGKPWHRFTQQEYPVKVSCALLPLPQEQEPMTRKQLPWPPQRDASQCFFSEAKPCCRENLIQPQEKSHLHRLTIPESMIFLMILDRW